MRCIRDYLEAMPSETFSACSSAPVTTAPAAARSEAVQNQIQIPSTTAAAAAHTPASNTSPPTASHSGLPSPSPSLSHQQPETQSPPSSDYEASIRARAPGVCGSELDGGGVNHQQPGDPWAPFRVSRGALDKCCHCIDIVTADMHDANCFTKAYARYVKGTGSVLATEALQVLDTFPDWGHREGVRFPFAILQYGLHSEIYFATHFSGTHRAILLREYTYPLHRYTEFIPLIASPALQRFPP